MTRHSRTPDLTGTTAAEVSPSGRGQSSVAPGGVFVIARLRWIAVSACNSLKMLVAVGSVAGAQLSPPFVLAHPNDRLVVELVPQTNG